MKFKKIKQAISQPWAMRETDLSNIMDTKADGLDDLIDIQSKPLEITVVDGIGIIPLHGVLMGRGVSQLEKIMFGFLDIDEIEALIDEAVSNPEIGVVFLDIASPGGSVQGIQEISDKIWEARKQKPFAAYTQDMICSAGYWIASQCHLIMASPSSLIGSIGVYSLLYDFSKAFDAQGIKPVLIKAGTLKGIGLDGLPITEPQIQAHQDSVNFIYEKFTGAVQRGRDGMVKAEDMQGLDYWAEQAKTKGLIDEVIADYGKALAEARLLI